MRHVLLCSLLVIIALLVASCSGGGGEDFQDALSNDSCAVLGLSTRIVNGAQCGEASSPVVHINILYLDGSTGLCSGALVTQRDVVTAAHCFFSPPLSVSVRAGDQTSFAESYLSHPNVSIDPSTEAVRNDVAVLRLQKSLSLPSVPLILGDSVQRGDTISIFGYGRDENGAIDTLRSGEMRVSDVNQYHISAMFFGEGSNSCNGDSGGPAILVSPRENGGSVTGIVGLVSSGFLLTCQSGDLSLFTNLQSNVVSSFLIDAIPGLSVQ